MNDTISQKMITRRIGIIGGGASGLVAAISAARANPQAKVFLLEQKEAIGKKILATGNGRCNLTNRRMESSCYRGENLEIVDTVLKQFGYEDTMGFFTSLGLFTKSRGGYIYPRSDQASTVVELLSMELDRLEISVYTGIRVTQIKKTAQEFVISAEEELDRINVSKEGKKSRCNLKRDMQQNAQHSTVKTYMADCVILSCGGKASASLGSDGSGYVLAKSLGHTITPVVPALVQLKIQNHPLAKASGVRTDARVIALEEGRPVAEDTGELQVTAYGISGIPVFQISRYIAMGLYQKKPMAVQIDFVPEQTEEEFRRQLLMRMHGREEMNMGDFLLGIFPKKLIPRLLEQAQIRMHTRVSEVTSLQMRKFIHICKALILKVEDTNGFDHAQVCAGGVCTSEINPHTMESLCTPGLYLSGELLDIDGVCGGYNLQWAWATGYLAGRSAACHPIS